MKNLIFIKCSFLIFSILISACSFAYELINPETDFEYLGAFKLPSDTTGTHANATWSGGGSGMTFYPSGNNNSGSLFSVSHTYANYVAEFSIPTPVISLTKNLDDLNRAETIQHFYDVTGGRQTFGLTGSTLKDIQYLPAQIGQTSDKLYWTMYEYYMPPVEECYHGWCEMDLSSPAKFGLWRLGNYAASRTSRYLFEIPKSWANVNSPNCFLAGGRYRAQSGGSFGPCLYAFGPWNWDNGNPPTNGASVDAIELLSYPQDSAYPHLRDFSNGDDWSDGAWISVSNKSAVIIAGTKAFRTTASGLVNYGAPQPDEYGGKGYHANPHYAAILFYDQRLLAKVANGELLPHQIQPYAVFNAQNYLFRMNYELPVQGDVRTYGRSFSGVGYDSKNNLIYFIESNVEGFWSPCKPIVHVFKLTDKNQEPDLIPPSVPENLYVISNNFDEVIFAWSNSTDNVQLAGYLIFRNNFPLETTLNSFYKDDKVNPDASYEYEVLAWDARDNRSEKSSPLIVKTPGGTDVRIPLISNISVTEISTNSAVINWQTDELAGSHVEYGPQYHGHDHFVEISSLTNFHSLVLTNLNGAPSWGQYEYYIVSWDAFGNTNEYPGKTVSTAKTGADNFPPFLNPIGSKIVAPGDTIQIILETIDLDFNDTLVLTATNLPAGASFDSSSGTFLWTPDVGTEGSFPVSFFVTDNDGQFDSENIVIFVEEIPEPCLFICYLLFIIFYQFKS